MLKNKMLMQAQLNNMGLCPKFSEFDRKLCFSANRLKEKNLNHFPKVMCEEYLISLFLKHWLIDKTVVNKQQIHPALASTGFQKLSKINLFYSNITIGNDWENLSEKWDLVL